MHAPLKFSGSIVLGVNFGSSSLVSLKKERTYVVKVLAAQKVPQHRSLYIVILLVVWRDKKVSREKIRAQLFSMLLHEDVFFI